MGATTGRRTHDALTCRRRWPSRGRARPAASRCSAGCSGSCARGRPRDPHRDPRLAQGRPTPPSSRRPPRPCGRGPATPLANRQGQGRPTTRPRARATHLALHFPGRRHPRSERHADHLRSPPAMTWHPRHGPPLPLRAASPRGPRRRLHLPHSQCPTMLCAMAARLWARAQRRRQFAAAPACGSRWRRCSQTRGRRRIISSVLSTGNASCAPPWTSSRRLRRRRNAWTSPRASPVWAPGSPRPTRACRHAARPAATPHAAAAEVWASPIRDLSLQVAPSPLPSAPTLLPADPSEPRRRRAPWISRAVLGRGM
mmetsp:Transcript_13110/g.37716  ORF Transcript_13110/g.37716 Transcript_13110/m.37716 type:complete len:313 (+) Transcript_13110:424-1362(+)